ncbi:substrate-binding periplasmic protein [Pseudomonas sp. XK-1]|jgi:polar amino acid transport system substrate-binding protein|uniref:substrate-binding periplasmic protein n=1 Tax=Pseudomonas sp. XK-1 TaxID=3136019 RepID=UPI0031195ABF
MANKQKFLIIKTACWLLAATLTATAQDSPFITLHYNERAPYLQTLENGEIAGLTATPAAQALRHAGIDFKWEKTPSNRQIQLLERNAGVDCMVGWFKNPQRELIGNFSLPLYQDKPTIGLALFSNINIDSGSPLAQVLQNRELRLLVKDGYSYGEHIDALIHQLDPRRMKTTVENINMLRMIALDRADYFFIAEEEASELIRQSEFEPGDFKYIHFSDSPDGGQRHLWCSKQVPQHSLDRINRAITELRSSASPQP